MNNITGAAIYYVVAGLLAQVIDNASNPNPHMTEAWAGLGLLGALVAGWQWAIRNACKPAAPGVKQ